MLRANQLRLRHAQRTGNQIEDHVRMLFGTGHGPAELRHVHPHHIEKVFKPGGIFLNLSPVVLPILGLQLIALRAAR